MIREFEILEEKAMDLCKKVNRINKKAKKHGLSEIKLHNTGEKRIVKENGMVIPYITVQLEGEVPHHEGWKLISIFERINDLVFTKTVPGRELPRDFLDKKSIGCDHCNHKRNRKRSYLLFHELKGFIEVGSTCLKDFFEIDAEQFVAFAQIFHDIFIDDKLIDSFNVGDVRHYDLISFLAVTKHIVDESGYVNKKKAAELNEPTTSFWVEKDYVELIKKITDNDIKFAKAAIAYFAEMDFGMTNEYEANCKRLTILGYVPFSMVGYAASMIPVFQKYTAKKVRISESKSEYVGAVKAKIKNLPVTVMDTRLVNGYYGVSTLFTFKDMEGNILKTFYSGIKYEDVDAGDKVVISGVIKSHDEWKGEKQTTLTRISIK